MIKPTDEYQEALIQSVVYLQLFQRDAMEIHVVRMEFVLQFLPMAAHTPAIAGMGTQDCSVKEVPGFPVCLQIQ